MESKKRVIATVINDVIYDQRMIRTCRTLAEEGYDVILVGREKSGHEAVEEKYRVKRFRFLINKGPVFYLLYNLKLFLYLMTTRFDIVHSVDLDTLAAGFFASRLKGKALIYDAHEYFTEVPELINRPGKRKIWLSLERFILPKIKHAITVSESIAEEYKNKYGVEFGLVRNAPFAGNVQTSFQSAEPFIIYQGALNKGRGLEALIDTMPELNMKLRIAGTGDIENELKERVESKGIQQKVEFLGNIAPDDLKNITCNAFAAYNVSENLGKSYYYSLNNKFFDYIHAGVPALTNAFPEYVKLNKEYNCVVFAEPDPQSILREINLLSHDTRRYAELKKNCFLAAAHLNWSNEAKRLLIYYAKIH